jgi:hypothetical protein
MTVLLICRDTPHLWLSRNHILHHLFSRDKTLFHINILIIEKRGAHPRVKILGMVVVMLIDLCKRGVGGRILDQCGLPGLIVVGLMIGHGRI